MAKPKQNTIKNETTGSSGLPQRVLTPEEQAIVSRVDSEDTSWMTIREDELEDFALTESRLKLPEPAKKLYDEKKYAFRWCRREAQRVDELTRSASPPLKWAIVNRQNLPEMRSFVDDILGCVCTLDQMLLFKPYSHHARVQALKMQLADSKGKPASDTWSQKQEDGYDFMGATTKINQNNPYKISGSDEVMASEEALDGEDLSDLVVEE